MSSGQTEWDAIIGNRTADDMKRESSEWSINKMSSNVYQRLVFLQKLFTENVPTEPPQNESDNKDEEVSFYKPVDDPVQVQRGDAKLIDDTVGMYSLCSPAGFSLDAQIDLKGKGKYYYEVELVHDPLSYDGLHIGFVNDQFSHRVPVGSDSHSYGYNGAKNRAYHMNAEYGKTQWKAEDVLGFMLEISVDGKPTFECFLNGESQGVAFQGNDIEFAGNALFAAFSLRQNEKALFIFDETKFRRSKPADCKPLAVGQDVDSKQEDLWQIDGEMSVERVDDGFQLQAVSVFPSVTLKASQMTAGNKYYFELVAITAGTMQCGVADTKFVGQGRSGGVGDDAHSWAVDLCSMRKWGQWAVPYGNANWSKGDVVGCCLDLDSKTISYSLNGKDMGIAFENVDDSRGLRPALSVTNNAANHQMMMAYMRMRQMMMSQEPPSEEEQAQFAIPESITYCNLMLTDKGLRYKANGTMAMTETVAFKAMNICNSLKEYSYDQYKADYQFLDSVVMLSKDEDFDVICQTVGDDTLIVCDFFATWCGPCVHIAPYYHALSEEFKDVVFLKADVDKLSELSQAQQIEAMPTFKLYRGGEQLHQIRGADKEGLRKAIEQYK